MLHILQSTMRKLTLGIVVAASLTLMWTMPVYASEAAQQICEGIGATGTSDTCSSSSTRLDGVIRFAINTISVVAGIVGVIMVIISGLKYITAQGDSSQISSAKNTLLYAMVGLVIAGLAQIIVHFVLNQVSSASTSGSKKASSSSQQSLKDGRNGLPSGF